MTRSHRPTAALSVAALCLACAFGALTPASQVRAETLLIQRVGAETGNALPARGMSMADVERRFGAPSQRLEPRGGQKRQWPTIHRWTYPTFIVYFEKSKVIDAVLIRASTGETGPKPAVR